MISLQLGYAFAYTKLKLPGLPSMSLEAASTKKWFITSCIYSSSICLDGRRFTSYERDFFYWIHSFSRQSSEKLISRVLYYPFLRRLRFSSQTLVLDFRVPWTTGKDEINKLWVERTKFDAQRGDMKETNCFSCKIRTIVRRNEFSPWSSDRRGFSALPLFRTLFFIEWDRKYARRSMRKEKGIYCNFGLIWDRLSPRH